MGIKRTLISNAKQGLGELGPWFDACGSPYMGIRGYPNILIFGLGFMTSEISMYGHKRFFLFLGMTIYGLLYPEKSRSLSDCQYRK